MIASLRGRRRFAELRESGTSLRHGPLVLRVQLVDGEAISVAYALGRPVGSAVVRNRLRRRLRALVAEIHRSVRPWPAGRYLFSARPAAAALTFDQLRAHVAGLSAAAGKLAR